MINFMRKLSLCVIGVAMIVVSCTQKNTTNHSKAESTQAQQVNKKDKQQLNIQSILMKRSACFGPCPVYNVTFNNDGTAAYEGIKHVAKKGHHTGTISTNSFKKISSFINEINFKNFNSTYSSKATDLAGVTIIVTYKNGKQQKVTADVGQAPTNFWVLTKTVDGIVHTIDWTEKK